MWPCAARAANVAVAASTAYFSVSAAATSALDGVASITWRQRLRIVGSTSSVLGAHSTQTVPCGGSSTDLSSALALASLRRSASSTTNTCHDDRPGRSPSGATSSRASATEYSTPSGTTCSTSTCAEWRTATHSSHSPHPPRGTRRAAANASAAVLRPEPGGPVTSQACVIAPAGARRRAGRGRRPRRRGAARPRASWPTRSAKTSVTGRPASAGRAARRRAAATVAAAAPRPARSRRARGSGAAPRAASPRNARRTVPWNCSGSDSSRSGVVDPAQAGALVDVEHHGQVGDAARGSPSSESPSITSRPARVPPLVGHRGVEVAVGHDDLAALEGGQHDRAHVLAARSAAKSRASARASSPA